MSFILNKKLAHFLKFCLFIGLFFISYTAQAEYYNVYEGSPCCGNYAPPPCPCNICGCGVTQEYINIESHSPHRHSHGVSSEQGPIFQWVPDPWDP